MSPMTCRKDSLTYEERYAKCGSMDKYEHGYVSFDRMYRRFKCRNCGRTYHCRNKQSTAQQIDIAVYSITNPAIVDAIIDAHNRGIKIRIITDRAQSKGKGSLVAKLSGAGIPVVTNRKHKIEHNKFAIFDGTHIVSGSYNWTTNASKYNSENCLFFDQPDNEYSNRFEYLWKLYGNK